MIRPPRRIFILLLCLCLVLGAVSSRAEETMELPEEDSPFMDRFGMDAVVETDANGKPVLVNGYPTHLVRAGFNNLGQRESFQMVTDFVDYPFWQPATRYDGNLAVMSLMMAGSANRPQRFQDVSEADFDPSQNLVHFLSDAGFTDIRKDDYSKVPTMFTVSTAMGHREMSHEGQEPFTLIAVGVCGGGYKNEWESNMTAGTGPIHEGFRSAAQLVIDRLAGYIATRGIQGRIKVWISGFSRAAAVSNVVAGTLVNTGFLPKEDVYAYTFATPAAVKDPPREGYENIFNIIDPADPVPQVAPAVWGYGRYGTQLFLSVQEFSSYFGFFDNAARSYINKETYNVNYTYSPALTLRTRLLISLLLDLTEDMENYTDRFQPALVSLMHSRTVNNSVSILRDMMQNIKLLDREDKTHLDELIDYFLQVFSGLALRSGYDEANRNTGSPFMRLVVEHTVNSYLSAVDNIRYGAFESNENCCYVMARGPVSLTLWDDSSNVQLFTVRSDGQVEISPDIADEAWFFQQMFYTERTRNTTVICVPTDCDFRVIWTAEKDGTLELLQAQASVWASSRYPGAALPKTSINAGDSGLAYQCVAHEPLVPDGFAPASFSARALAEFMGIASLGFNWRLALTLLFALLALLACICLCLAASFKPSRHKQYSFLTWTLLCVLGVAALETEAAYWFFADQAWVRILWKAITALSFVLLFFQLHEKKDRLLQTFFPSVLLAAVADVVISIHFFAGAALFLLCHALLTCQFQRRAPLSRGKRIQWAVVAVMLEALIILFYVPAHGAIGWAVAIYAPVLLLMAFSSGNQSLRVRVSAILFLISDLLLGLYGTLLTDPMIHVIYMFLFYTALLMLTLSSAHSSGLEKSAYLSSRKNTLSGVHGGA